MKARSYASQRPAPRSTQGETLSRQRGDIAALLLGILAVLVIASALVTGPIQ